MAEPLRRSIRVRCPIEHAFIVFTERIDQWWPVGHRRYGESQVVLEGKVGGRFIERATTGEEAKLGEVVAWEPPHRLSYTWQPGAIDKPTHVEVRFTEEGPETLVEVVHSEGDSALGDLWQQRVQLFSKGWEKVLPPFQALAEESFPPTTSP